MPGELMGIDGVSAGAYTCNAVALEDAEVCAILQMNGGRLPESKVSKPALTVSGTGWPLRLR